MLGLNSTKSQRQGLLTVQAAIALRISQMTEVRIAVQYIHTVMMTSFTALVTKAPGLLGPTLLKLPAGHQSASMQGAC